MNKILIINNNEDEKECTSPYGNNTFVLTREDIEALLNGKVLGDPNWDETNEIKKLNEDPIQKFIKEHDIEVTETTSIEMNEIFFEVKKEGCLLKYCFKIPYRETRNERTFRNMILFELKNAVKEFKKSKTEVNVIDKGER